MNESCANVILERLRTEPTISVDDTCLVFGIGRTTGYAAIRAGEWPIIKVRNRLRVPSAWVLHQLHLDSDAVLIR